MTIIIFFNPNLKVKIDLNYNLIIDLISIIQQYILRNEYKVNIRTVNFARANKLDMYWADKVIATKTQISVLNLC